MTATRRAEVEIHGRVTVEEVAAYLPGNYRVIDAADGIVTIEGEDNLGWTLDGYVIPRLASGMIHAKEVEA